MNVVLITLDTLRREHMGCYGYEYNTTPYIDAFSKRCLKADNAYTTAPVTLSAHASMLTSLYPFQHGLRDNGYYYLDEATPTLTKLLKDKGYNTAAFVGSFVLDKMFGLNQGFDVYDDVMNKGSEDMWVGHKVDKWERDASVVTDKALEWYRNNKKDFFMWIHYFDCHTPYEPVKHYPDLEGSKTRAYDEGVKYVDEQVGRFLDSIESLDDTIVVILGDHGEAFGEHNEVGHGLHLYDTTVKIPFMVYNPKKKGDVIDCRVSVLDVAPTILTSLGEKIPECMYGADVYDVKIVGEDRDFHTETYYRSRLVNGDYAQAIYSGDTQYIKYSLKGWCNSGGEELVESGDTPFDQWLEEFKKQHNKHIYKSRDSEVDKKIIEERLHSLGYL